MLNEEAAQLRISLENRDELPLKCCNSDCLQTVNVDDAFHAIDNAVFFYSFGKQSWHAHIKVLYLCSLSRNNGSTTEVWPTKLKGQSFIIPSCRNKVCVIGFRYLLGISKSTFHRVIESCKTIPSAITEKHKLTGKNARDSNKMNVNGTDKMIASIHEVLNEYSLEVPLSKCNISDEVQIKMLPPHFSRERLYTESCLKIIEADRLSRSSFYRLICSDEFKFVKFSKREKGICDKCVSLRETIRGLQTKYDPISTARRICLDRELENHVLRQRMSRHLYRLCRSRVRKLPRIEHELETDHLLPNNNMVYSKSVLDELEKMKMEGKLEEEEQFEVHAPFTNNEKTAMISWDYARHLSIPHKSRETMGEHFASTLGYNAYLFGIVDESTEKQYNYVYGEEHNSKGSQNVCSMVFHFLQFVARDNIRNAEHLIIFIDGCGGENKNRKVCAFLRSLLYANICVNLNKISVIFMEVGHTKFAPDAGFGLIRCIEKNTDVETLPDVIKLISNSTPKTSRNIGVLFEASHFYNWNHDLRFRAIPAIRKQKMIQYLKVGDEVHTRTKLSYKGKWHDHGSMLLSGKTWPNTIETDMEPVPIPKLKPSRILHIRQTILPHISAEALPWWNSIAPEETANEELERNNIQKGPRRKKNRIGNN